MISIDVLPVPALDKSATALAHALFDEVIAPAAAEGKASYFPLTREPERTTYFLQAMPSQLVQADFDFPGGGDAEGLIDALVEYWTKHGENRLAASGPRLKEITAALRTEAVENDGDVDPYCYTMF